VTPEQRVIVNRFSAWQQETETDFEELLDALAASFREQAQREEHPDVRGCLGAVAEHLSFASVDFYCSTK
jgi:hypothetical protein